MALSDELNEIQKIKLQAAYDLILKPNYIGEGDRNFYPCVGSCEVLPELGLSCLEFAETMKSILGWAAGRQCGPSVGIGDGTMVGLHGSRGFVPSCGVRRHLLM